MTAGASPSPAVPPVSIGIPTYNRAATLSRAVDSVLAQTRPDLELVISDNASSDETQELCEQRAALDGRIRYLRQAVNQGPTANFNLLFTECRGAHVMMLSDDDWLEPDYVERCLAELSDPRGHSARRALVCGVARYFRADGQPAFEGAAMQLDQPTGAERVRAYFAGEKDNNGTFYGLIPRHVLGEAAPLLNVLGNDWLLVAAIAYQGTVRTLSSTAVNRSLGGTSVDIRSIGATLGKPTPQARVPHLVIAWHTFAQIGWRAPVYRDLSARDRLALAVRCAPLVIDWRSLAWHLTAPTAAALDERPWGRGLARAYERITRALGAGAGERR
jgi:hypothetical protein